jgi:DDE family transposase
MCYVAVSEDAEAVLAGKFAVMRRLLDERQWRVYLGTEALALGHGGIAAVARAARVSETTVAAGAAQARDPGTPGVLAPGRARRPGAGRPKAEDAQPGLTPALRELAEEATRGDPVSEITWCSLSLRDLERRMAARGFRCGKDAVARMLRGLGYSLQGMAKVLEGSRHPGRDGQFRHINAMIRAFRKAGHPVVSVDTKKKEQLGPYHRDGRAWRPEGDPVRVRDHDFPDQERGKITPYGVYDITANRGFVSVGTSHDTAAFAVSALRLWWQREGSVRYPGARRLLVTCDAGGSNGYRCRLWKDQLAVLAAQTGLKISVVHFPPGTSKWNRIEHRLFCHITRTWRARPLMTAGDAVAGIAATVTSQGLKCTAVLDTGEYPEGARVSGDRMRYLEDRVLIRHGPHRDWNYTILPVPRPVPEPGPEPEPQPGPDPALLAALAALAGIPAPHDLPAGLTLAWTAAREHRLTLERGRERLIARKDGSPHRKLPPEAILTAAACRIRLRMTWALLGRLLGVHYSSISVPASNAIPIIRQYGITPDPAAPRITTPRDLLQRAAAAGIALTIPEKAATPAHHAEHKAPETTTRPRQPT